MLQLIRLPSDAPEADERPFILLVPGGGFVNVWNLTEGWPPPMGNPEEDTEEDELAGHSKLLADMRKRSGNRCPGAA